MKHKQAIHQSIKLFAHEVYCGLAKRFIDNNP